MGIGVTTQVANRHLGRFALMLDDLDQIATTLFGQRRHRHTDEIALRSRIETEIGIPNRLFNFAHHVLFPRLDTDGTSINQRDVGHLINRHHGAVVIDLNVIKQAGMGAAGTDFQEVILQRLQRFLHLAFGGFLEFGNHLYLPQQ